MIITLSITLSSFAFSCFIVRIFSRNIVQDVELPKGAKFTSVNTVTLNKNMFDENETKRKKIARIVTFVGKKSLVSQCSTRNIVRVFVFQQCLASKGQSLRDSKLAEWRSASGLRHKKRNLKKNKKTRRT